MPKICSVITAPEMSAPSWSPITVVTEQIFGIAGFGRLTVDSIAQRDYALLQGVVLVVAVGYVIVNLLVDVAYSLINPRIRVAGTSN